MLRKGWLARQSLLLLIAAALILPAIVAVAVGFASSQAERRRLVELNAMTGARQMTDVIDAELSANLHVLRVIGEAELFATREWVGAQRFAAMARRANPYWQALVLRDSSTGEVLVEDADEGAAAALRPLPRDIPSSGLAEGSFRQTRHCPCVILHRRSQANPNVVLTLYLDPQKFQRILLRSIRPRTVAAIVDGEGRFLARSLHFTDRVGTPATIYVRRAVAKGGEGFYEGRTYEGLENFTAYSTSPLTGWSAHLAVDRSSIDGPRANMFAAIAIALTAGLVLALALVAFAAHDGRVKRRDQKRLMELQKADTISQFTSIIIHDFRNLLAASYAGLNLIDRNTQEPKTREAVEAIRKVVQRGERLVNRLLSFARTDTAELGRVDLGALLEDMDDLLRRVLGGSVAYRWAVDPAARFVRANADQLELALVNLARNSREAMDGAGEFSVVATSAGEMVAMTVCDSGPGVPPEIRERVFDPFYTTKAVGAGTGLGLTQVEGAVRHAGGRVEIGQLPTGGARFRLLIPRAGREPVKGGGWIEGGLKGRLVVTLERRMVMNVINRAILALGTASLAFIPAGARAQALPDWSAQIEELKGLGDRLLAKTGRGGSEEERQDLYDYILGAVSNGYLNYVAMDPARPTWAPLWNHAYNYGGANPDYAYMSTVVESAGIYRISGYRGTARFVEIAQQPMDWVEPVDLRGKPIPQTHRLDDLKIDENGYFSVVLSARRPDGHTGDWWKLDPSTRTLLMRKASYDWKNEVDPRVAIVRLDERPAMTAEQFAGKFANLKKWVTTRIESEADRAVYYREHHGTNVLKTSQLMQGLNAVSRQVYLDGAYQFAPDEALIVETEIPEQCDYWQILVTDSKFTTVDWVNHQSSLNGQQARRDNDGRFRAVVAARDPGVPNWLDTAGNPWGVLQMRWNHCSAAPEPTVTKVALKDVRQHLPIDTPEVSPQERKEQLLKRREAAQLRHLW